VAEEVVEVRGDRPQHRISGSRGLGGYAPPKAVAILTFILPGSSPDLRF